MNRITWLQRSLVLSSAASVAMSVACLVLTGRTVTGLDSRLARIDKALTRIETLATNLCRYRKEGSDHARHSSDSRSASYTPATLDADARGDR